ncbi:MAG: hypothetical protein IPM38_15620 [Ignavibacteria bacterium]|nr:hypothetical protein [Ignavibacteria bacterium]
MTNSKLIPVLKSFSKEEIKEFDKFLNSPYFGCKKFVLNFYRELAKLYPLFSEIKTDKKKLFAKLYGGKKYNDGLMRRIISDLIRYAEEYLKLKNFRGNKIFQNQCLLNELRKRNLGDQFRIRSESMLKKIKAADQVNPESLLETYFVNMEVKEFRTHLRDSKMHEAYALTVETFTVFFLRIIYSYINHRNTFSREIKKSNELADEFIRNLNFKEFLNYLENNDSRYSVYLKMVLYSYNIVSDKNDRESYFKLNKLLIDNPGYFSEWERNNLYVNIIKFLSYQNESYDNIFIDEEYKMYEILLSEYYLPGPSLTLQISFCRNYINICRQIGEFERIKAFLKKYSAYFPADYKEDLISLCESVYHFEKRNFTGSVNHASKVSFNRDIFKFDIKILKIKNFYELGYFESAYTELDTLKHLFSSTENIKPGALLKGKNFVKYFSSVLNIKMGNKKAESHLMKKLLSKEKNILEKNWLILKVKELS